MIKKLFYVYCSFILLLHHEAAVASVWSSLHPSLVVGSGYTRMGESQNVWLANTPEPGLENNYSSGGKQNNTVLFGLALEKALANLNGFDTAVGIEFDYLRTHSISEVVHPMINVAPDFDTLNYSYKMSSYLLQATAKLSKVNIFHNIGGYFQVGMGGARNNLSDYTEESPIGSSAAPMLSPFGDDESTIQFAYSIGAGILCQPGKSVQLSIGYRYINSGMGGLKKSPLQQTNDTLEFSPISHHFIILGLTV